MRAITVHLIAENHRRPATNRAAPYLVTAKVHIELPKMHSRVVPEMEIRLKTQHIPVVGNSTIHIFDLEDDGSRGYFHARSISAADHDKA